MTNKSKIALSVLAAAAVVTGAQATPINGGISFNGNVTPYVSTTGSGTVATDYTQAHSIVFGPTVTALGANGTFAAIPTFTSVSMYGPLLVNPPGLPVPTTFPIWSITSGGITYSFTLSTLTESNLTPGTMNLTGTGIMSDGTAADSNTGVWLAAFTTSGSTFSWNSSSSATVPEAGTSLLLLGLGLTALGAYAQFRKQAA